MFLCTDYYYKTNKKEKFLNAENVDMQCIKTQSTSEL